MLYYLQDHATSAILFIHENEYLVSNLKSGILDCYLQAMKPSQITVELQQHSAKVDNNTGIKIVQNGTKEFSLEQYADIASKQKLIKIRKHGFVALLEYAKQYRSKKTYGFYPTDPFVIESALADKYKISEYATIMGVTEDFAKQELRMISESMYTDQFRIFTICNFWKKKINALSTEEEMNLILPEMRKSFGSPGFVNA